MALSHVVGGYGEFTVPVDLEPYAQVLWRYRPPLDAAPARHRVVPEPDISVCYRARATAAGEIESLGLLLVGPVRTARVYAPVPGERMYAIRLKPEWCRPLLGTHPSDHDDALDDLTDVAPERAEPLLDRLAGRADDGGILRALAEAVRAWAGAAAATPVTEAAHKGLELLRRARPGTSIQAAWEPWAGSSRHLRRAVRTATGSSPKRLVREKRLAGALYLADRTAEPAWSRIALASGYYDQSHLIRDCGELAGATPGALHRERRSQPEPAGPGVSEISNTEP